MSSNIFTNKETSKDVQVLGGGIFMKKGSGKYQTYSSNKQDLKHFHVFSSSISKLEAPRL